jgi:hypothetical protein
MNIGNDTNPAATNACRTLTEWWALSARRPVVMWAIGGRRAGDGRAMGGAKGIMTLYT